MTASARVLCECGCGLAAPIATYSSRRFGWVRGQPKRFVHGHHRRGIPHTPETKAKMSKPRSLLTQEERTERARFRGRRHYIAKARFASQAKRYGISPEVYEEMNLRQGGLCAICGQEEKRVTRDGAPYLLSIDHDHETGQIRALLCHGCNAALGLLCEDPDLLRSMLDYLEEHAR